MSRYQENDRVFVYLSYHGPVRTDQMYEGTFSHYTSDGKLVLRTGGHKLLFPPERVLPHLPDPPAGFRWVPDGYAADWKLEAVPPAPLFPPEKIQIDPTLPPGTFSLRFPDGTERRFRVQDGKAEEVK